MYRAATNQQNDTGKKVTYRRNLAVVWLDYQKAFDSIPHGWIIKALQLAKVPQPLVAAIHHLTKTWYTTLLLRGDNKQIKSDTIHYQKGILQGDSLSVLLFVLSLIQSQIHAF